MAVTLRGQQPNIVIVNIDDMGWGDFAVYGSQYAQTPNIDVLANQGTRFTQFYNAAPICSPSRAGLLTGQYAARSGITSFLNDTAANLARDMANNLSLTAPSMARTFHDAGYATGHFGKWHLGGGRDVGYATGTTAGTNAVAPRVVEYGFDQAWTQMEGLGNRIINVVPYGGNANGTTTRPSAYYNGLNQASESRGTGGGQDQLVYLERQFNADFMANKAIQFIDDSRAANPNKPFFLNYWPDEVHTVNDPPAAYKAKYDTLYPNLPADQRNYLASLEHVDAQIGRIVNHIDELGLGNNTLILVTADNGAVQANADNLTSNGPFRGGKGDVFEGGVREPLIARWTGHVTAGRTDTQTVMWTPDLFPTLTQIAGVANPAGVTFDGENLSQALLGAQSQTRTKSLFWNMNRGTENAHSNPNSSGAGANGQEVLAIRNGNWKLLINAQGTAPELYDVANDLGETTNRAVQNPTVVNQLAHEAFAIRYSTPSRTLPDAVTPLVQLKADALASLGNNAAVANWNDAATGDSFNGNVSQSTSGSQPTLLTNSLNGHAVLSFDGNDSLVSSSTNSLPSSGKGITVFAVATSDTSGNPAQRLGQVGSHGGTAGKIVGLDVSNTSTSSSNGGAGFRFNDGASLYNTPIANAGFHIVAWQVDNGQPYTDATMYVDGTLPANIFTGASNNTPNTTSFSGTDLELILGTGRSTGGSILTTDYFTGKVAEFLIFNEQLSVGQINLVANYLGSEYGLPFAYDTNLKLFNVTGLAWVGATANFDSAWNAGNGQGGPAGSNTNPFTGGAQDLYLGNGGTAQLNDSTNTSAGISLNTMRIGTARPGFVVSATDGNGALTATGTKSLTIGNGSAPASGAETGDLTVGEGGYTGTLNWNSTGTLKVEGRLRVGDGGVGIINQENGVVTAGDVGGTLKFIAIGSGAGSSGTYNLKNGRFLPGGGTGSGVQLRNLRIGYNGATGTVTVGDGIGAANSASIESTDDLYVGYDGNGSLTMKSDGRILLVGNNAPVFVGFNSSVGIVTQQGGTFQSDGDFSIGDNTGASGLYEIQSGTLHTAADGAANLRIGRDGGHGTLRVSGNAVVTHADVLTIADGAAGTEGRLELVGSAANVTIGKLENVATTSSEVIRWVADSSGVTPLVVNAASGTNRVQLQDPTELAANTGQNGNGNLTGDGIALELDLSALLSNHTLTLIDNRTIDAITGFFENGSTENLYEEGATILGTGFDGTVTISYYGGTGNDVTLSLVALQGDYNRDGQVNTADYVGWRKADINGQQGFSDWRANFGNTAPSLGSNLSGANLAAVPEPGAWITLMIGIALLLGGNRYSRRVAKQRRI